jgi:hypothetical protein
MKPARTVVIFGPSIVYAPRRVHRPRAGSIAQWMDASATTHGVFRPALLRESGSRLNETHRCNAESAATEGSGQRHAGCRRTRSAAVWRRRPLTLEVRAGRPLTNIAHVLTKRVHSAAFDRVRNLRQ